VFKATLQRAVRQRIEAVTFEHVATTAVFLLITLVSLLMPAQNDTWWQLRAGQEAWRSKHVLLRDTFSHTAFGNFWPNHEWLTQVLFYALYAVGGMPLLTIAMAVATVTAWLLIWRLTPAPERVKAFLFLFCLGAVTSAWSIRPQVLSTLFLSATMTLLIARRYFWLPLIFLLWANIHGAVVMGILILVTAVVATAVEDRASLRQLVPASLLCLGATLVTPLGLGFWPEIVTSLARIRRLGIHEWSPPTAAQTGTLPFWLFLAVFLSLLLTRLPKLRNSAAALPRGHLTLCLCALAMVPLALTAGRNVPPFLMLAVPAVAALAPSTRGIRRTALNVHSRFNFATIVAAAVAVCGTVTYAYVVPIERLGWAPLPQQSLQALRSCRGNLYNRYDEGGYLIWFAPEHKVFLDGRQDPYPETLINEQFEIEQTGQFEGLFSRYDIRCAYLPPESLVTQRLQHAGWTTLYRDRRVAVLAR
jgi:hypothetical protein